MEKIIEEHGALILAGLSAVIIIGGFIVALETGVGDVIVSYVNQFL